MQSITHNLQNQSSPRNTIDILKLKHQRSKSIEQVSPYEYWLNRYKLKQQINKPMKVQDNQIDADCAICMSIMVEPCKFPACEHYFCIQCTRKMIKRKPQCPLDRKIIDGPALTNVDESFQKQIKIQYPKEFHSQNQFLQQQKQLIGDSYQLLFVSEIIYKKIQYEKATLKNFEGLNFKERDQTNIHNWTIKIRIADPNIQHLLKYLVQDIHFDTWPFDKTKVTYENGEFIVKTLGWEAKQIPVQIVFVKGSGNSNPFKIQIPLKIELDNDTGKNVNNFILSFKSAYFRNNAKVPQILKPMFK